MSKPTRKKGIREVVSAIENAGILLVYPIDNRREPASIWSSFYPRSEMRWEWDTDGDDRVADLWHLRAELARSGRVVYTKWFRGRATFFSREIFVAMLASFRGVAPLVHGLSSDARRILEILEQDSPLSTKELRKQGGLQGRAQESAYSRALQLLWSRLLIVGYGEVEDGAFPSLAVGATQVLFEDLWNESKQLETRAANERLKAKIPLSSPFLAQIAKSRKGLAEVPASIDTSADIQAPRRGPKIPAIFQPD